MQVRLTQAYKPPPEWGQLPYREGLIVHGDLAVHALRDGAGVVVGPELENKVTPPTETKRRGRPPKHGSTQ
jgi:hypothetical protein